MRFNSVHAAQVISSFPLLKGLRFLFVPDWNKLLDVNVWRVAMEQVMYSLSVGGGGLVTFGSYNKFKHKVMASQKVTAVLTL